LICKFIITNQTETKSIVIVNIHLDSILDSYHALEHSVDARTISRGVALNVQTDEINFYTDKISYHKTQVAHILHRSTHFQNTDYYVIAGDTNYRSKYDSLHRQDLFNVLFKSFNDDTLNKKLTYAKDVCHNKCDTEPTQSFSRMHETDFPHKVARAAAARMPRILKNTAKLDIMVSNLNFDSAQVIYTESSDHSYILGTINLQELRSIAYESVNDRAIEAALTAGSKKRNIRKSKKSKKQRRPTKKTRHTKKRRQTKTKSKKYKKSKKIIFL